MTGLETSKERDFNLREEKKGQQVAASGCTTVGDDAGRPVW